MIYLEKPIDFKSKFDVVGCFLESQGEFLLLHRQNSKPQGSTWGIPGGKVEIFESTLNAIYREIEEETGYKTNKKNFKLITPVYVKYPDYDFIYHIYNYHLLRKFDVVIDLSAHKNFKWVTPQEALNMDFIQDLDACIAIQYGIFKN